MVRVRTRVPWYHGTHVYVKHDLKNDLKYKHSGATGTLPVVGVVSIEDTVHVYNMCTNITLSQKRLEIQALRCNGDTMA